MFFSIDVNNGVAIYEQIVRQVKFAIAEESLKPGQLLPSVRGLSVELALNHNTIARAYQLLQSEGVLEAKRGRGFIVCTGAPKFCRDERKNDYRRSVKRRADRSFAWRAFDFRNRRLGS